MSNLWASLLTARARQQAWLRRLSALGGRGWRRKPQCPQFFLAQFQFDHLGLARLDTAAAFKTVGWTLIGFASIFATAAILGAGGGHVQVW